MILSDNNIDELKKNKEFILKRIIITILLIFIFHMLSKSEKVSISFIINLVLIFIGLMIYIWQKWAWLIFIILNLVNFIM